MFKNLVILPVIALVIALAGCEAPKDAALEAAQDAAIADIRAQLEAKDAEIQEYAQTIRAKDAERQKYLQAIPRLPLRFLALIYQRHLGFLLVQRQDFLVSRHKIHRHLVFQKYLQ